MLGLLLAGGAAGVEVAWVYDTSGRVVSDPSSETSDAVVIDARAHGVAVSAENVADGWSLTWERSNAIFVKAARPGLYIVFR